MNKIKYVAISALRNVAFPRQAKGGLKISQIVIDPCASLDLSTRSTCCWLAWKIFVITKLALFRAAAHFLTSVTARPQEWILSKFWVHGAMYLYRCSYSAIVKWLSYIHCVCWRSDRTEMCLQVVNFIKHKAISATCLYRIKFLSCPYSSESPWTRSSLPG